MSIGERIREIRNANKLTMEQFGARIGVTKGAISSIESGKSKPSEQTTLFICQEFGANREWLLTGNGEMLLPTEDRLIAEMAEIYHLDELDRAILKLYLRMDANGRAVLRHAAEEIVNAVVETPGLFSFLDLRSRVTPQEPTREQEADEVAAQVHDAILNGGEKASESGAPLVGSGTA